MLLGLVCNDVVLITNRTGLCIVILSHLLLTFSLVVYEKHT